MSRPHHRALMKNPPGSSQAKDAGCRCPVLDNSYGRGRFGDADKYGFVVSSDCKLHWADGCAWEEP